MFITKIIISSLKIQLWSLLWLLWFNCPLSLIILQSSCLHPSLNPVKENNVYFPQSTCSLKLQNKYHTSKCVGHHLTDLGTIHNNNKPLLLSLKPMKTAYLNLWKDGLINNWFIHQHAFIEIWSTWEVWRHERCIRVARGIAESNSSFLSALQTSQVLHISMNAQLMYEPIIL